MTMHKKQFLYGDHQLVIETGGIARQADGAVMVSMGDTCVLVTAVGVKQSVEGRDFFPLTVNYQERTYAAGKIPGGYFKREGRPTEKETLTSRLIDRPLRPLFPTGFTNEVQIVATVLSLDSEIDPDIPAMIGASAALAISGIPFSTPIGAARVGYKDGIFLLNPKVSELKTSKLDLVVAGTESAVLMVESEAQELSEEVMLSAVLFGHEQMQIVIENIKDLAREVGTSAWDWQAPIHNGALEDRIKQIMGEDLLTAYQVSEKLVRKEKINAIRAKVVEQLAAETEDSPSEAEVATTFAKLEKSLVRSKILVGEKRIDGRDTKTVRPLTMQTGVLPRTHGSALFTRGETQALVVTTLGTSRDAQVIDALGGDYRQNFMLHYNFPPYCVGETGMMTGPKRREIGHGRLARRGIQAVLPNENADFPYVVRVVSEITESNGSSSMASVCGTSLALMDAGVPIKAQVAGIAMGLIKEGDKFAVLTDILGDEDHLGDMDFKVAGTRQGVTALQMDIKIDGITKEIMQCALEQAKEARLHILVEMDQVIDAPRVDMSEFAPRITTMRIAKDKIRDVIGKGGATIRALTEETGATIEISDEGVISISAIDSAASEAAKARIEDLVAEVEVGAIYAGKVIKVMDFGAFVTILPGKDGLVHISQIADQRIEKINEHVQEGQEVRVKVLEIDRQGRIRLSMKEVSQTGLVL